MNEQYYQTLKSVETEDWLDFHVIRPFCFQLARLFAKFDIHPNTVTIWSIIIGAGSSFLFASGCYYYEGGMGLFYNLAAIFLLTPENTMIATAIVFVLSLISGFMGMGGQQRLADYYIQVHLFFLKGEKGSELDNSLRQQEIYDQQPKDTPWYERQFQKSYVDYTRKQEKSTPQFQRLMALLKEKYGSSDNMPDEVRKEFHRHSLSLMKWNGLLTFNFRESWFFLFCLLDIPVMTYLFEIIGMGLLTWYINQRHESFSRQIADKL